MQVLKNKIMNNIKKADSTNNYIKGYWNDFLNTAEIPTDLFNPRSELTVNEQKKLFQQHVRLVALETSSYCNRKCSYCPVSLNDERKNKQYMKDDEFNSIINELHEISFSQTLSFNLYNEPLADENIFQWIEKARFALPDAFLMFNSNGDYIDSAKLDKLQKAGLNHLLITLHSPVGKPYDIKERGKFFKKFLKKLGLDDHKIEKPYEDSLELNADWNGLALRIKCVNFMEYGNSRTGSIDFLKPTEMRTSPCVRPFSEFIISWDGSVLPCCQFYPETSQQYIVGNATSQSIFEIYSSKTMAMWRREMFTFGDKVSPCDTCKDADFSDLSSSALREQILKTAI
jgi:radical SAM protein with 4Fe4S-binding SPASM domain